MRDNIWEELTRSPLDPDPEEISRWPTMAGPILTVLGLGEADVMFSGRRRDTR